MRLWLVVLMFLSGCAVVKVRDCVHCGYGVEADLCGQVYRYCAAQVRPTDNCSKHCHWIFKP